MKISIFPNQVALNGTPVLSTFVNSLTLDGITVVEDDISADVAVIWSVLWSGRMKHNKEVWDIFRSQDKPVIVLEVGCLKRNITWKIGINGINSDAEFGNENSDNARVKLLDLKLKPWKNKGDNIIICGQHSHSEQWRTMPPQEEWILGVIDELRKYTDRKIIIRPHPRHKISPKYLHDNVLIASPGRINGTYDSYDFENVLGSAWAVINYSSNPSTESVMEGVPVFVSNHSLAYPVGNDITNLSKIENPSKPAREQWLNDLSYTEWTVDEINAGLPWNRIKKFL